jgi:TfoX/Sxy family transcriptional regulator of competence genes
VSTSKQTIAFIEDQLAGLPIRTAPMFGEYALYFQSAGVDDKVVGFICDDTLFIKPSDVDAAVLDGTVMAPAYPGSKLYHSVPGELLEDSEWLHTAITRTAEALPAPKPKRPRRAAPKAPRSSGGAGF